MADQKEPSTLDQIIDKVGPAGRQILQKLIGDEPAVGDAIVPTSSPIDLLAGGLGSKIGGAMAADAGTLLGNEIGSIGADVNPSIGQKIGTNLGKVTSDISQAGNVTDSMGVQTPTSGGQTNYGKVISDPNFSKYSKKMAAGGDVEPEGLDEFLSSPQTPNVNPQLTNGNNTKLVTNLPQTNTSSHESNDEPQGLDEFLSTESRHEKFGSPAQQALAGVEGAAQGVLGPLAPLGEKALGIPESDILGRKEENPLTHSIGEIGGLAGSLATGVGEGALAAKAGELATTAIGLPATMAGRMASGAAKAAIENMAITGGDEVSSMILNDPNQSAQTAMADVGLSGLIGGAAGGLLGAVSPLWHAAEGTKTGQLLEDFKGELDYHLHNPNPVESAHEELSSLYNSVKATADPVYGPNGLKAQEIAKVVPELSPKMFDQSEKLTETVNSKIRKMMADTNAYPVRLTNKLNSDMESYLSKVNHPDATPGDIFNATQDLKQTLQGYAKFEKRIAPFAEEYDFVRDAKALASTAREALEDKSVWGKAAERQESINKAFTKYLPSLKDFESKFTTEIGGERIIDPGKVNTFVNAAGKESSKVRQTMLKNFIDASDKYKNVIADTHANLGLENPTVHSPLSTINRLMEKPSAGQKLAQIFIDKGLTEGGAKGLGAATGAAAGSIVGHPGIGALVGSHVLGPFYKSVLPAIAKSFTYGITEANGAKSAIDYGVAVAKGNSLIQKAAKSVFTAGRAEASHAIVPTDAQRAKLDKQLKEYQVNPQTLLDKTNQSPLGHYAPEHAGAAAQTVGSAVQYLNSLRPNRDKQAPLDPEPIPSPTEKAAYTNALNIAIKPTVVLDKVKNGTVTVNDMKALMAMSPDLYKNMAQQLTNEMVNHIKKGDQVPYSTKMGVSLFLGQPMDSTMMPNAIVSAQPQPKQDQPQPQQGKPMGNGKATLGKASNQFLTGDQARQKRQNKI